MLMLQPVHSVTDATWKGGGATSSHCHFQLITIVVVSGPRSDRSTGGGSSLQFQVQFQTMIFGDCGAGSAVIPLELSPVVLLLLPLAGCGAAGVLAGGVGSCAGAAAGGTPLVVAPAGAGGTAGGIGAGTAGTTGVSSTAGTVGGATATADGSGVAGTPTSPNAAGAAASPSTAASARKQTRWVWQGRPDILDR